MSKNSEFNVIESLFTVTKTLIMDKTEIRNVKCLDCATPSWTEIYVTQRSSGTIGEKQRCLSVQIGFLCMGKVFSTRKKSVTPVTTVNIAMWETRHSIVDQGLFQDSDFAGDLEDSTPTSGGFLCIFGSRTFCAHQLDVQKSKLQYHTALQNLKLYRWMLVCAWPVYLLFICVIL